MYPNLYPANELSSDKLYWLIESKLHWLTEMLALSTRQSDLVAKQDTSALMTLLSQKQEGMGTLRQIQCELVPFQRQDPEQRLWADPARRKTCQNRLVRCDQLLQQLIDLENRSLDKMSLQRDVLAAQLQQTTDASTLQQAYQASECTASRIENTFDLEG